MSLGMARAYRMEGRSYSSAPSVRPRGTSSMVAVLLAARCQRSGMGIMGSPLGTRASRPRAFSRRATAGGTQQG